MLVPVPEVGAAEGPVTATDAPERARKLLGESARPVRTPGPGCDLESSPAAVSLAWAGAPSEPRGATSGTQLRLTATNVAESPIAVAVTVRLTAGRRAREWRSVPFELAPGEKHDVDVDLTAMGLRDARASAAVDVQASAALHFGDDRLAAAHDSARLRGAVEHAAPLAVRREGDTLHRLNTSARAAVEGPVISDAVQDLMTRAGIKATAGFAGLVDVDESKQSVEDALEE